MSTSAVVSTTTVGASVSADRCDLNHRIPWPVGATDVWSLDPACRRDHLLITHAGWSYEQHADGSRTWTTSSGHVYKQQVDGSIVMQSRGDGRLGRVGAARGDGDPPF